MIHTLKPKDLNNSDRTVIVAYKGLGVHNFKRSWTLSPYSINAMVYANVSVKGFLMRMQYGAL